MNENYIKEYLKLFFLFPTMASKFLVCEKLRYWSATGSIRLEMDKAKSWESSD